MADFNKVILVGNLTRDPEMRHTSSGAGVCTLGMAINRKFTSQGETREETCFVDISVWGRQGESCTEYLRKGRSVLVEGRLKLDQWDDRETGKKRSRLSVVAERVQFLSSPQRDGGYEDGPPRGDDSGGGWQSRQQAPSRQQYDSGSQQQKAYGDCL